MAANMTPPGERDWRFARMRDAMSAHNLDGILSFGATWRGRENVRYATGSPIYSGASLSYLPVDGAASAFFTGVADLDSAATTGWIDDLHVLRPDDWEPLRSALTRNSSPSRIGVAQLEILPVWLRAGLDKAVPQAELVNATKVMDQVRLVKSDWEVEQIRKCGDVCAQGWERFVEVMRPGLPEYELVAEVEAHIKALGAQDNFMIIASGKSDIWSMIPPSRRQLEPGDMVRTELTPQMNGYWSQICRVAVLGEPDDGQKRSFDLFNESVEAGLSVIKPGVTAHEVARAENDVFRKYGYGEYCTSQYTRVRGHGLGLHFDEVAVQEGEETVFEKNSVFVVHPNTYTPLAGYHVLGDPVVVTDDGYEILAPVERKLFTAAL
jgi:Xaa-Pro aminopeptidase